MIVSFLRAGLVCWSSTDAQRELRCSRTCMKGFRPENHPGLAEPCGALKQRSSMLHCSAALRLELQRETRPEGRSHFPHNAQWNLSSATRNQFASGLLRFLSGCLQSTLRWIPSFSSLKCRSKRLGLQVCAGNPNINPKSWVAAKTEEILE